MPLRFHHLLAALICLSAAFFLPTNALSQTSALSASDRQALLYAPQLNFARNGEPIIRLGIDDSQIHYSFIPNTNIFVLPSGRGGPRIELPKGLPYDVKIVDPKPGKYEHSVTVERIPFNQKDALKSAVARWTARGFKPEVSEVGGLFSIHGNVFDSRLFLINVKKTDSYKKATESKMKLEHTFGVYASVHSVLSKLPDGTIELYNDSLHVKIVTEKVLTVIGADDSHGQKGSSETVFTIPNLTAAHGNQKSTKMFVGELVFAPARKGSLAAMINTPAERVLKGTVPAETFPNAPSAALQAQAIAARNNLMSSIGIRNLADPYMLRTDVMDQVYGGIGVETSATNRAVDATRGQVMMADKRIIHAVYSSNAAGLTVNNDDAWDMVPMPWLRSKLDTAVALPKPFPNGASDDAVRHFLEDSSSGWAARASVASRHNYRWRSTISASTVTSSLQKVGVNIGALRNIVINERGLAGRVKKMTLVGTRGKYVVERELNIRQVLGGLKSALFVMTPQYGRTPAGPVISSLSFIGGGYGHGVGMCQTGAIARAEAGQSAKTILTHYYSGVAIQKLY